MRSKKPTLILACLWLLFSSSFTTTVTAETTENEPVTSAGLETIVENKDNTEVTISYVLEDKKDLILKTDQEKVIDIEALKKDLGAEKVSNEADNKELRVTLDNPDAIDFKMYVDKEKPFSLAVLDADRNEMFNYQFNAREEQEAPVEDDPAEESTWTRTEKLRVSKGPILEHKDGSSTQPIFYFGDYIYAEHGIIKVSDTWIPRHKSRENSLTSPNSGIIYAEPGSRIENGPKAAGNHVYTTHYGDNQKRDGLTALHAEEDLPYGSPTSYTSNNLFNYVSHSDDWKRPGVSGPNKLGKSYAMLGDPTLYYRVDSNTGLEEQRLVYKQRAFYSDKHGKDNPEITTSIKMSFTRTGRVVTDIAFKNTGKYRFYNFSGISNHDLSLNKDGAELTDTSGKKIGNYIPMRSLGNERGMYFQAPNNEIRTNIYMDHPKGPGAWAARSASRSYLATKGYMYNPGLLGLLGVQMETYYPWKVGKSGSAFYDKKKHQYKFPYTPPGYNNAFSNERDLGDKNAKRGAGTRLGTKGENDPQWDAGVTMRTHPMELEIGQTVHLQYGVMTDIPGSTFNPVVEYDKLGNENYPQVVPLGTSELELSGHWYDFDSDNVTIYYAVNKEEDDDIKNNILLHEKQSKTDASNGKFHDFSKKVNISHLEKGLHKVSLIAEDSDGNQSILQEHHFKIIKTAVADKGPQIDVTSPYGTKRNPYIPATDHFEVNGFWSDQKSSKIKSLSYTVDGGPETVYEKDIENPELGNLKAWRIRSLDIKKYNDFKKHRMVFKITDDEGATDVDFFYFKHTGGGTHLTAPEKIDFGKVSLDLNRNNPLPPNMNNEKVLLEDFRKKGSNQLGVQLTINKFYKDDGSDFDGDDEDDGDDSLSTVDPDKRASKESLRHKVYWDGKPVSTKNIPIGKTVGAKSEEWRQSTDFTEEVSKKLKINFRARETGTSPGKYVSYWTWQTVDSIQ